MGTLRVQKSLFESFEMQKAATLTERHTERPASAPASAGVAPKLEADGGLFLVAKNGLFWGSVLLSGSVLYWLGNLAFSG